MDNAARSDNRLPTPRKPQTHRCDRCDRRQHPDSDQPGACAHLRHGRLDSLASGSSRLLGSNLRFGSRNTRGYLPASQQQRKAAGFSLKPGYQVEQGELNQSQGLAKRRFLLEGGAHFRRQTRLPAPNSRLSPKSPPASARQPAPCQGPAGVVRPEGVRRINRARCGSGGTWDTVMPVLKGTKRASLPLQLRLRPKSWSHRSHPGSRPRG